jgi:hypothetical protein
MINLNFSISNPFVDRFANIFNRSGKLSTHKAWEFEILKVNCILNLAMAFTTQRDHAGLKIEFGLLGYEMYFQIYDNRHWNYVTKDWQRYD